MNREESPEPTAKPFTTSLTYVDAPTVGIMQLQPLDYTRRFLVTIQTDEGIKHDIVDLKCGYEGQPLPTALHDYAADNRITEACLYASPIVAAAIVSSPERYEP